MHITSLASGSGGNCFVVSLNGTHILIDAGISLKRLESGLKALGLRPLDIYAVLVTHEHTDHISGLAALSKRYGVPILAPPVTAEILASAHPAMSDYVGLFNFREDFALGDVVVRAFRTAHDTPQSAGFKLSAEGYSLGYCTDLGYVSGEVLDNLAGVSAVVIEANHDLHMLKTGSYPAFLKRRILSDYGHLSNESCARLAVQLADTGTQTIVLAHLSDENNRPDIAAETVFGALAKTGHNGISVTAAPPSSPLSLALRMYV